MSKRFALCLNSSFLGYFAHAGFLRALLAMGLRPASVSGASAGALVAGLFAAGVEPREMLKLFQSPALRGVFREPGAFWRGTATILNLPGHTGALRGKRALALLREQLGDRRIEQCTDPTLAVSVTNLTSARSEAARSGPLAEMLLASGAFPGMFAACAVEDQWLWDGGVANPTPIDHWFEDPGIDAIVLHLVGNPGEMVVRTGARPRRMSHAMNVSHQVICDELLRLKTALAQRAGKRLIIVRTLAPRPRLWHPARIGADCADLGAATVEQNRPLFDALSAQLAS